MVRRHTRDFCPHFIKHELSLSCVGIRVPSRDSNNASHTSLSHRIHDGRHALSELGHGLFELLGESQDRNYNIVALEDGSQRGWVKDIGL